jgi:hypothetical protein
MAGASALAVLPFARLQAAMAATTMPRRDAFSGAVGSTFQLTGNGITASAVLAEVADLRPTLRPNDPDRYSLVFTLNSALPQGIYTFRQKRVGSVDLFATPVDRGVKIRSLQAIVNR